MDRDPSDFAGNPNPPAKPPEPAKAPPAPKAATSSAGSGALPPEAQSQPGAGPLAPGSKSTYSVVENDHGTHDVFLSTDRGSNQVGVTTLSNEDADKVLKASGAPYDESRKTYDQVPEDVVKALASGKPAFTAELKARYGAGEAELHRAALYDSAVIGRMTFSEARERSNPDLAQVQLAHYPAAAWKGLGDAMGRLIEHPIDTTEDLLRQSIMKTAEALPSIASVIKGAALGGAAGAGAGMLGGPFEPLTVPAGAAYGARTGTFMALLRMEVGGVAADMHERGFDEKTIRETAVAAGSLKAAMWMYGAEAMAMPFKGAFLKGLGSSEAAQGAMKGWLSDYAMNAGVKMPAVGAAQSVLADLSNNLAALADRRPDLMRTSKDFTKNAMQAAIDMMQVSAVAGVPGAAFEKVFGGEKSAAAEKALAAEVDAKLAGFERREPVVNPALSGERASPSGEQTSELSDQTASSGRPLETPQAPSGNLPQPSPELKPLPESIKDHPSFVKAVEQAKADLPEGVEPTDQKGVIKAYTDAAKESHDYANQALVLLGKDELGKAPLTPDERNQISAHMDMLASRMSNLRGLASFARDPETSAAYEDWIANGQQGEPPARPIDPFSEALGRGIPTPDKAAGAEAKFNETLDNKEAKPDEIVGRLGDALRENEKLLPKMKDVEAESRVRALNSDLEALQQRIGEIASTRDRMQRNGLSTKALDRQVSGLVDQAVGTQKHIEMFERFGSEMPVRGREAIQMKPATLEDIVAAGFKEGTKQSQTRARELLGIAKENGLTANDVKKLIGNRAPGAMGDVAFRHFVEGFQEEGSERTPGFKEDVQKLVERKQARADLAKVIQEKQIERERYVRQLNGLPSFNKMTTEQLKSYADILRGYDKNDAALAPKRIAALRGTILEDVKTEGEVRGRVAELTGQPITDFQNVRVPLKARAIPDPQLRAWYPALRPFVDLAGELAEKGDRLSDVVQRKNNELAAEALRERRATMGPGGRLMEWAAPQQREVMKYMEARDPAEVSQLASQLTPKELKWANWLKSWFSGAENYLIRKEELSSRFSGAYVPHVNRGWIEVLRDLKEQGLWKSLKEMMPGGGKGDTKAADFVDKDGNVLGFNKFFKQSQFRSGEMVPSKNVVAASNKYISDYYHKVVLDQAAPVLDTLARSMKAPEDQGFHPKEAEAMTSSLQDFVKAYVNNKKGINNSAGAVGELLAPALRVTQKLVSLHFIAGNYALQAIKGSVAIPISEYMVLGTDLFKAKALKWMPGETGEQARSILSKYESFTGKSPWQEITAPGADVRNFANGILYGGFSMAHKAAMEDLLLGSMTKDEFKAGEISDKRLNDIRQNAGRWLDLHGSDSIMGSSAPGKAFTQYKSWAIPPTLTLAEDAAALARTVKSLGKEKMTSQQVHELMRLSALGGVAVTAGAFVTKDMEDDTFTGQAIHYLRRALGSVWHGLDPEFFISKKGVAAGVGYAGQLASDLHLLLTLERDKDDELKGAKALQKDLTPRIVKDAAKVFNADED